MQRKPASGRHELFVSLILLLGFGVVINVAYEMNQPDIYAMFQRSDGEEMVDLADMQLPSLLDKVGFAVTMREAARGGKLIVPADSMVQESQVEHLAGMEVSVGDYDAEVDLGQLATIADATRVDGLGRVDFNGTKVEYSVVWQQNPPAEVMRIFTTPDGGVIAIDERLVADLGE